MLSRFAVESSGIGSLTEGLRDDVAAMRSRSAEVLEMLYQRGLLVYADEEDREALARAVKQLPQAARQLWATMLPMMAPSAAPFAGGLPLQAVESVQELIDGWSGKLDVALFSRNRAVELGVPNDACCRVVDEGLELTRMDLLRESPQFASAAALGTMDIEASASREQVWSERLCPLIRASGPMTVVDRYAAIDLVQRKRPTQGAGVEWFMKKLASSSVDHLHLIAQANSRSQAGQLVSTLRRALAAARADGGTLSVTATFADPDVFREHAHSRHLRVDRFALVLDRGLATFERESCGQSTPCHLGSDEAARKREEAIERAAYPRKRRVAIEVDG